MGLRPRKGVHRGPASPGSTSQPHPTSKVPLQLCLTPAPDFAQPWLRAPWRSCCSACPRRSRCWCCGSWGLVCCGPCWASWGPWPWAPSVGMRCCTCCRTYVQPLPRPLPQGPRHRTSSVPAQRQPAAAFWWGVWVKAPSREGCCRVWGASGVSLDRLSVRPKAGGTLQPAGGRRRTWARGCQCSEVSSCSSSWRTRWGSCGGEGASQ